MPQASHLSLEGEVWGEAEIAATRGCSPLSSGARDRKSGDFGTGYSSLPYLKIDQSFVRNLEDT